MNKDLSAAATCSLNYPKQLTHYISSAVDLDLLLAKHNTTVPNAKEYLIFLLSLINSRSSEFQQIYSKEIQQIVDNYRQLLDWLISLGILETDNKYIIGEKCKGYRYSRNYRTVTKAQYITRAVIIKKVINFRNRITERTLNQRGQAEFLYAVNYGYQPLWLRTSEVASKFNLKRNLMIKGFRTLGLLRAEGHHTRYYPDTIFLYEDVEVNGYTRSSLKINDDQLHIIEEVIRQYPELFPKKN